MLNTSTRLSLDPRARLGRRAGRRFLIEWAAIGSLGLIVILLCSIGRMSASVDHLVYDHLLSWRAQPVLPDIVVLEIDNESVAQLGRWPWPRSVHAKLLEQIARAKPAAVVYDVLFTEPNADDAALARAIALSPTYLPVLLEDAGRDAPRVVVEPVAPLARAAAGLGHINLEVDSDGIVRSVAQFEGDADARWPQLMVTVARAAQRGTFVLNPQPVNQASAARGDASNDASNDANNNAQPIHCVVPSHLVPPLSLPLFSHFFFSHFFSLFLIRVRYPMHLRSSFSFFFFFPSEFQRHQQRC